MFHQDAQRILRLSRLRLGAVPAHGTHGGKQNGHDIGNGMVARGLLVRSEFHMRLVDCGESKQSKRRVDEVNSTS